MAFKKSLRKVRAKAPRKDVRWNANFDKLRRFQRRFGHVQVPRNDPGGLSVWLAAQRTGLPRLTLPQIRKLWDLGVRFSATESRWFFQFFRLAKGREKFGDANDPRIRKNDPSFKTWISAQRGERGKRTPPYRRRLLRELGFLSDVMALRWERRFAEVAAFHARFGHTSIPRNWPGNPRLSAWLSHQRRYVRDPERKKRLQAIGCFDRRGDVIWDMRFTQWQNYVRKTGTTSFPKGKAFLTLANWSRIQRIRRKEGALSAEKIQRLNRAGFPWDPHTDQWESSFRRFAAFWKKHRRIPLQSEDYPMAIWCWDKIRDYKLGVLPKERIARFNALGFPWDLEEAFWQNMFAKLKKFRARFGHCRLPNTEDIRLRQWVARQRQFRRKGELAPVRVKLLNTLGLDWNPYRKRKQRS